MGHESIVVARVGLRKDRTMMMKDDLQVDMIQQKTILSSILQPYEILNENECCEKTRSSIIISIIIFKSHTCLSMVDLWPIEDPQPNSVEDQAEEGVALMERYHQYRLI